jgi:hypothetical protein
MKKRNEKWTCIDFLETKSVVTASLDLFIPVKDVGKFSLATSIGYAT